MWTLSATAHSYYTFLKYVQTGACAVITYSSFYHLETWSIKLTLRSTGKGRGTSGTHTHTLY